MKMDTSQWVSQHANRRSLSRTNSVTNSIKSSLSTIQHQITRYRKYVMISSILLILSSSAIIFYSMVLINWYLMPNLMFWDGQFHHAPYFLLALGIYKGLTALYGFAVYNFKNRFLLSIFAILLVIGFAMQMTSIALFWNVRTTILVGEISGAKIAGMLKDYGQEPEITNSLDYMQQHLSCCGGNEWQTGYIDYKYSSFGKKYNGVPDSCCVDKQAGCGRNIYSKGSEREIAKRIYVNGCIGILRKWMEVDILPMIWGYTFVGISIALLDIIFVALVCAYIAQITRRQLRQENKNFVDFFQFGISSDKRDIHYPKQPDSTFLGIMLKKTKDKTKFRNKFMGGKKEQFEQDRIELKKLHKEDDINKSVSQFLSHGISTDSFQCETIEKLPKVPEPEYAALLPKNEAPEAAVQKISNASDNTVPKKISDASNASSQTNNSGSYMPSIKGRGPLLTVLKKSYIQNSAELPNIKITEGQSQIKSYQAEPKTFPRSIKGKALVSKSPSDPATNESIKKGETNKEEKLSKTEYSAANRAADLRAAWIRDNMTLHKHPSALESGSLSNVTKDKSSNSEPVSREVRSLTPEKPEKPARVKVTAYNNTQSASLETNL